MMRRERHEHKLKQEQAKIQSEEQKQGRVAGPASFSFGAP